MKKKNKKTKKTTKKKTWGILYSRYRLPIENSNIKAKVKKTGHTNQTTPVLLLFLLLLIPFLYHLSVIIRITYVFIIVIV